jgi:hypothetical protein
MASNDEILSIVTRIKEKAESGTYVTDEAVFLSQIRDLLVIIYTALVKDENGSENGEG